MSVSKQNGNPRGFKWKPAEYIAHLADFYMKNLCSKGWIVTQITLGSSNISTGCGFWTQGVVASSEDFYMIKTFVEKRFINKQDIDKVKQMLLLNHN